MSGDNGQTSRGWFKLDNAAAERSHEVGPAAFMVYAAIARHVDEQRRAWPGIDRLGQGDEARHIHGITGLSPRWVRSAIRKLETAGWILVQRTKGSVNVYTLPPIESKAPECKTPETSKAPECKGVRHPSAAGKAPECRGVRQPSAAEVDPLKKTNQKDQSKKTKERGLAAVVVELPEGLDCEEFREAWTRWTKHRKEIRESLTPSTTAAQLKRLGAWGVTRAVAAIDYSIEKGWKGIYEESSNGNSKHGFRTNDSLRSGAGNGQPSF